MGGIIHLAVIRLAVDVESEKWLNVRWSVNGRVSFQMQKHISVY